MANALDSLTIHGFKSIQSLENFELKSLNVFIGANGAGKSNLLEVFRLLRSLMDDTLQRDVLRSGGISAFLHNGPKVTQQLYFEVHSGKLEYSFGLIPSPQEQPILIDEMYFDPDSDDGRFPLGDSPDGRSLLKVKATGSPLSPLRSALYNALCGLRDYHFHDTSANAGMRLYEIIQDNKELRQDGSNLAPYLLRLRESTEAAHALAYQEILSAARLVMPFFDTFLLDVTAFGEKQKVNLSWRQKGSDYPMQPYHFSDGSIRFICLATALLQPNPPSTIILDEPELGLHPSAIALLAELIQDASSRTQLIVATQSPALIDYFGVEDIVVVNRKNGASTFIRLQEKDFTVWLESYSVGELWRKNVIAGGPQHE